LRNLESLAALCTISLLFYVMVMIHIIFTANGNLWNGVWTTSVNWWRPAGMFQCLPIFTMALSCQPQVFEIYEAIQVLYSIIYLLDS
jgi:sodium-coupled neutral amino acid transporter 10